MASLCFAMASYAMRANKDHRERALWRGSLRSREKRERRTSHWSNETQGRLRREVMPPSEGRDAPKNIGGSDAGVYAPGGNKARFSLSAERWEDQNQVVVVGSQTGE